MIQLSGYRNDYNVSDVTDLNNAICQQVTTPDSDEPFRLTIELSTVHSRLTVTVVVGGGDCLEFPATMSYRPVLRHLERRVRTYAMTESAGDFCNEF